jgi:tetratricopeptide (TPR) repeat protein
VPQAAARLAWAERAAGRPDLARLRVTGALRSYPHAGELLLVDGELLEDEGKPAEALFARQGAHDAAPADPAAALALARSLALAGESLDRAPVLADAALANGRTPDTLEALALIRAARGEYDLALALADEGIAAAPGHPALGFRRAEALAGLGRAADARAALAEAEKLAPPGPRTAAARARVERLLAPAKP